MITRLVAALAGYPHARFGAVNAANWLETARTKAIKEQLLTMATVDVERAVAGARRPAPGIVG